jgi:uncharacterized OsmC-like protein
MSTVFSSVQSSILVKPFGGQRQAVVSLGDTHFVVGSSTLRDTRTQPSRPVDLLLAALAVDCTFTCQDAAAALGHPLPYMTTSARWIEPNTAEIQFTVSGLSDQQCHALLAFVEAHCQLYNLLANSMPIILRITG